jgi:glutathione peroxidase
MKYSNYLFYGIIGMLCIGLPGCGDGVQSEPAAANASDPAHPFYSFTLKDIDGWPVTLSRYEGQVALVVNVASECRYTHQYTNMQKLYMKYKDQGFVVLGIPTNDFGRQEPGTDAEIKEFITRQYNILFPMFSKVSAKGEDTHPLFQYLTSPEACGELAGPVDWNFNKFLIDKDGTVIGRFPSKMDPMDPQIIKSVEAALP